LRAFGAALKQVVHLNLNSIEGSEAEKIFQELPSSSVLRHLIVPIHETSGAANIHTKFPNLEFLQFGGLDASGYRAIPTEALELPHLIELRAFSLLCPPDLSNCNKMKILSTFVDCTRMKRYLFHASLTFCFPHLPAPAQKILAVPACLEELNTGSKSVMNVIELPSGVSGLRKLRIEAKHSAEYSSIPASPLRALPDSWKSLKHLEDLSITCAGLDEPTLFQILQNSTTIKSINVRKNFFKNPPNFDKFINIEEIGSHPYSGSSRSIGSFNFCQSLSRYV
jgi:hypothetical protein